MRGEKKKIIVIALNANVIRCIVGLTPNILTPVNSKYDINLPYFENSTMDFQIFLEY